MTANWKRFLRLLATEPQAREQLSLAEGFIDASFMGLKEGIAVGPTKGRPGTKILAISSDQSSPRAVAIQSASPHESQLVEETLGQSPSTNSQRLMGDAGEDSGPTG